MSCLHAVSTITLHDVIDAIITFKTRVIYVHNESENNLRIFVDNNYTTSLLGPYIGGGCEPLEVNHFVGCIYIRMVLGMVLWEFLENGPEKEYSQFQKFPTISDIGIIRNDENIKNVNFLLSWTVAN